MKVSVRTYKIFYNFVSVASEMYGAAVGEFYDTDCSERVRAKYIENHPYLLPAERIIVVDEGISSTEPWW
jgi:hypothetical protein